MPYEPLVILHIALTKSVSSNIQDVLKNTTCTDNDKEITKNYTNAIFYSINSCQKGLQQVDLGNALIKSCVRLLIEEMPSLSQFHTLSPIPGFRTWLDLKITSFKSDRVKENHFNLTQTLTKEETSSLMNYYKIDTTNNLFNLIRNDLNSDEFRVMTAQSSNQDHFKLIEKFLQRSCAFYLYLEKKNGYAFNSVANFHLKNGAKIFRLNFKGNTSENGWKSSYGMMVNYGYYLDKVDMNCINYLINKKIEISDSVKNYLNLFL